MSLTPPALRATSPFFDRGGAANALLAESNKLVQFAKFVNKKNAEFWSRSVFFHRFSGLTK